MRKARTAFLFVSFAVVVGFILWVYSIFLKPQSLNSDRKVVVIPRGANITKIAAILHGTGVIESERNFIWVAKLTGYEKKLKAGKFQISGSVSNLEAARILFTSKPFEQQITIPEGVTSRKIASLLAKEVEIDSTQFVNLVNDGAFAHTLGVHANGLEGYLFPDSYRLYWGLSAKDAAEIMVKQFFRHLPDSAAIESARRGYTLHQIVTLASIIEGEAVIDSERQIISAVYYNRLRKGIRLQADPTIQYIIPDGPRRLLSKDLQIDSPYNTYLYRGLPPGPINNPGRRSIEAALQPADVPYLYFVARGDGSHIFSVTLTQHNRAKQNFERYRREVNRKKKQQQGG